MGPCLCGVRWRSEEVGRARGGPTITTTTDSATTDTDKYIYQFGQICIYQFGQIYIYQFGQKYKFSNLDKYIFSNLDKYLFSNLDKYIFSNLANNNKKNWTNIYLAATPPA